MRVRLAVRTLSEICLTLGALIVLFVVYLLYWTGVRADRAMDAEIDRLQDRWSSGAVPSGDTGADGAGSQTAGSTGTGGTDRAGGAGRAGPPAPGARTPSGESFAIMYIPRFGSGWAKPVLQGVGRSTLQRGLGHYPRTAGLGEPGNFAVAGHRRTYGDPFKDFPRLRRGDRVVLTDGTTWYTYRVDARPYRTLPSDTAVIDPIPAKSGYRTPGRYLTLTTCDPEWGHSHRLIAWAHLERTAATSPDGVAGGPRRG
ncbi:class E sortase [Streptomyces palmae]|uniref:Class E sortase n=1 Tax=Streptomyces palmae TaxID=1701085 RepID=A0A4Z0GJF7_9ACTN|nr:class E sortase [Streptomyces palmae]TGA95600.1 class E sortase [Streptomyces palmae]